MQGIDRMYTGHIKGGTYCRQGGYHGHHGEKQDYTNEAQALLQDINSYKVLTKDPTSRLKKQTFTNIKGHKTNWWNQ